MLVRRRPGELFDRAIHVAIQRSALLLLILGPLFAIDETIYSIASRTAEDGILRALHLRLHESTHLPTWFSVAGWASSFLIDPLGGAAAIMGIAALSEGKSATLMSSYRAALSRWLGAFVWNLAPTVLVYATMAIAFIVANLIGALWLQAFRSDPTNASGWVRSVLFAGFLLVFALAVLVSALVTTFGVAGFGEAVLSERGLRGSLRASWAKAFGKGEVLSTLLLGLALLIILVIVGYGSNYVGSIIFGLTGSDLLNYAFRWIFDVMIYGFLAAFCYVYYSSGAQPQTSAGS
jgi:hypothetical protein